MTLTKWHILNVKLVNSIWLNVGYSEKWPAVSHVTSFLKKNNSQQYKLCIACDSFYRSRSKYKCSNALTKFMYCLTTAGRALSLYIIVALFFLFSKLFVDAIQLLDWVSHLYIPQKEICSSSCKCYAYIVFT